MGEFLDPLLSEMFMENGRRNVRLLTHFEYLYKKDYLISVPFGFVSDGASIPEFAWSLVGHPFDEYLEAAIIHDYLYRNGIGTKHKADVIFLQGMKDLKVNIVKRRIMYWCVVGFGKGSWK